MVQIRVCIEIRGARILQGYPRMVQNGTLILQRPDTKTGIC